MPIYYVVQIANTRCSHVSDIMSEIRIRTPPQNDNILILRAVVTNRIKMTRRIVWKFHAQAISNVLNSLYTPMRKLSIRKINGSNWLMKCRAKLID